MEYYPGVYSDKEIMNGILSRDIVIDPFYQRNLGTSSYDVCLGEWYYREHPKLLTGPSIPVYNIYDEAQVREVWGDAIQAKEAQPWGSVPTRVDLIGIKRTDKVILIDPGETILCHTQEFIGGKNHITSMMKARSSFGRNFIEICKCAGWGDVGYINRWTMEVTNNSRYFQIPLVVGRRIAQIIFFETGPILNSDKDYAAGGKYQDDTDLRRIKESWHPEMMLPKLYNDWELRS